MKSFAKGFAALAVCAAFVVGIAACSNAAGGGETQSGGSGTGNGTGNDGGQIQVPAASGAYTKIGTEKINGVDYDIVTFGLWPQTIKAANVDVSEQCESKTVGGFTYYKGSDCQWYAKIKENAFESDYTYSNGNPVGQGGTVDKWFKVEPIKWRVLTTNYNKTTGKKLLFAENILIGKRYDASKNNYQNSEIRKWLNSNANSFAESDYSGSGGFLKTAFTAEELAIIQDTSVNNSARSTNTDKNATQWGGGGNQYASDTPTTDKVFLLSEQEVTKNSYGFDDYGTFGEGSKRIRVTTDYAKACGAHQSTAAGMGGWWWLRSPFYFTSSGEGVHQVYGGGRAIDYEYVYSNDGGVVPALCVRETQSGGNGTGNDGGQIQVPAASGAYTKIGTEKINGVDYNIVTFGLWPQTIKAVNVDVSDQCESKTVGGFTYYKGSDGQWYAMLKENAYDNYCVYSDGTPIEQGGTEDGWFKVEPIKWRVLTTDYNGTRKKLLLAENILIGRRFDASENNYQNSEIRKWLNSNANSSAESDYSGSGDFLKTAFTAEELEIIQDTSVDNSKRSTNPDANATQWWSGENPYASDTPTTDKVFLLSEQEVTKSAYGFDDCGTYGAGNKRIRVTTDYAKASGAYQSTAAGRGGQWWLRSPYCGSHKYACYIFDSGSAVSSNIGYTVDYTQGVVPALCVDVQD